jgi:hypothetical protein
MVTLPSEKPIVFRMARSGTRSRIDWAMMLPVKRDEVPPPGCACGAVADLLGEAVELLLGLGLGLVGEFMNSASIAADALGLGGIDVRSYAPAGPPVGLARLVKYATLISTISLLPRGIVGVSPTSKEMLPSAG